MIKPKYLKMKVTLILIIVIFAMSLWAGLINLTDPNQINMLNRNEMPSSSHLLGTDNLGRDVLARVMHGGQKCLMISFFSSVVAMLIGFTMGSIAGWYGGTVDKILQVIMSVFQGLPGLSISIAVVGILGSGEFSITLALIMGSWASISRVVRAWVQSVKTRQFIEATKVFMPSSFYMIRKYVLPILLPSIIVLTLNRMGRTLLSISALSFIGVGIQAPTPDWGVMIQDARDYISIQPISLVAPAIMMCMSSFLLSSLAEQYRDYLDIFDRERFET